jgi:glucosamine--fructose-6-phosphate aminotransferase (isomerizing)
MCGIVGYIGPKPAEPILLDGLRRLEYRGYDSAGIATFAQNEIHLRRVAGRIVDLAGCLRDDPAPGTIGIGHTRWATHGRPIPRNAHPHLAGVGNNLVAVVHNGVIENYAILKRRLQEEGVEFASETDTEVIAQLIAKHFTSNLPEAVARVLPLLKGTYGLAVMSLAHPDVLVAARLGSPLAIGVGSGEMFITSDPHALAGRAKQAAYLNDRQIAVISATRWHLFDERQLEVVPTLHEIDKEIESEIGPFHHHMLKEIYEQPEALENALRGRFDHEDASAKFGGLNLTTHQLREIDRIVLTACGTSWHAALVGEYLIEEFARIPVEVEYASEFRYRNPPLDKNTIVIALTQSGETADTLAALRESKRKGQRTFAICNVVGSSIAREADGGIYLHAGREIGVASTKAFTNQVAVLTLLALYLGRLRHLSTVRGQQIINELKAMPDVLRRALHCHDQVIRIAERFADVRRFLYLGRQYQFPVALEGALKLKEISYIHAQGYPAAEMKHGPIALVDENTPSVFLMPHGPIFEKVMSNLMETKARGGPVIAVTDESCEDLDELADEVIEVPKVSEYLQPLVTALPLQLLAYHIGVLRGCDVDKPRNLAKSVTVE